MEAVQEQQPSPLVAIREKLRKPLPKEAIKQHPTKKYLSTVNVAYIIERLNDVFGENGWEANYDVVESTGMIVVRCVLHCYHPSFERGIERIAYGGNDNSDRGDAFKGACTDALSKAASMIGIAGDVYKGLHDAPTQATPAKPTPTPAKPAIKPTAKPVQKTDMSVSNGQASKPKATDFPHGANDPQETKPFVADDSDIPENIGSPKPTQAEIDGYGQKFKSYKVEMKSIGDWLRKRFDVLYPSKDLNRGQWETALSELDTAFAAGTLAKLLARE